MQKRELNACKHDIYSFLHIRLPTNTEPYRDWSVSRSGGNEPDRNGLFATVMNGPVDVAGNRITGVLDEARLSPGMQAALFGQREETGYANPVIVTLDLMP